MKRFDSLGYFYSGEERPSLETDSGYPSYDAYGEETSVDSPSTGLLPKRNSSNFLWVDFSETSQTIADKSVARRPKNHDRLIQARKNQNRHSAPPGSLEDNKSFPCKKFSCDTNGSAGGKAPVPSVIKGATSDKLSPDERGLFCLVDEFTLDFCFTSFTSVQFLANILLGFLN